MKKSSLTLLLAIVSACGDKDDKNIDTTDTQAETGESAVETGDSTVETGDTTAETGDSSYLEETTCTNPEFVDTQAFLWTAPQKYTGYTATVTNTHVIVADIYPGMVYGLPWVAESGVVETEATFTLSVTPYGPDKAMWTNGYIGITDALAINSDGVISGAVHIYKEETLDALTGDWTAEETADISIYGDTEYGYTGALLVTDVDGDTLPDALVPTGPLPGRLAVFLNIDSLSGYVAWTDADFVLDNICMKTEDNDVQFQSTNLKIFGYGSGDGYLALGCPSEKFREGEVLVFDLPLSNHSDPMFTINNVTGWRMDSNDFGEPLYVDNRVPDELVVVTDDRAKGLDLVVTEAPNEDPQWWGTSPTVTRITNDEGETCKYIAVGDPAYETKGVETGGVYASLLNPKGLPIEWVTVSIPSSEGDEVQFMGSVNEWSPDGSYLMSVGLQRSVAGTGGGMITTSVNY